MRGILQRPERRRNRRQECQQTVCDVFPDAKSFIESWKNNRYDLLLLDCYLSDENLPHATTGLDIARLLRNQNDDCAIVFITSSTDFAVLGYEVQASGYLLKPVNRKTFEATMERVEEQLKAKPPGHPSGKGAVARHGGFPAGMWRSAIRP